MFDMLIKPFTYIGRTVDMIQRAGLTREFKVLVAKVVVAIFVITMVIVIEGLILWKVSPQDDSNISKPVDGIYFIVPIIFGETTAPSSIAARVVTLIALLQGLILTTYLIAISAFFTIKGGKILTRKHLNHYIICGWNFQGKTMVQELLEGRGNQSFDIVVAPGDPLPSELKQFGNKIFVIEGNPSDDATLISAGVMDAKAAIVLNDTKDSQESADGKVLMNILAIETMNPDVYTCAQIQGSENEIHLHRANVDEIIPLDLIGANLAVASALNPGVTKLVSELVHFDSGSEIYKLNAPVPKNLIGLIFTEAQKWFSSKNMILIAVESESLSDSYEDKGINLNTTKRSISVNPYKHIIELEDDLFVISDDAPSFG